MEFVFVIIGIIIGVGLSLFLDVGSFSDKFVKKEEELDSREND